MNCFNENKSLRGIKLLKLHFSQYNYRAMQSIWQIKQATMWHSCMTVHVHAIMLQGGAQRLDDFSSRPLEDCQHFTIAR